MSDITRNLEQSLREIFSPQHLEVINESHLHAGHQPQFDGSGQTHFRIRMTSKEFTGKSRLERHRQINAVIAPLMEKGLHAIAIEAKAPGE